MSADRVPQESDLGSWPGLLALELATPCRSCPNAWPIDPAGAALVMPVHRRPRHPIGRSARPARKPGWHCHSRAGPSGTLASFAESRRELSADPSDCVSSRLSHKPPARALDRF
jgi:hypothetical protein